MNSSCVLDAAKRLCRDRNCEQKRLLALLGNLLAVFGHGGQVQSDCLLCPLKASLDGLSLSDHSGQGRHGHRVAALLGIGVEDDGVSAAHISYLKHLRELVKFDAGLIEDARQSLGFEDLTSVDGNP